MRQHRLAIQLFRNDWRLILRDQTLISMLLFALAIALTLRFVLPWLDGSLAERGILPNESLGLRVSDLYPMLVTFFAFFSGSQISGSIFGFLLLDEKDQRTVEAVQVTPIPINRFMLFRFALPALLGFLICSMMVFLINVAVLPIWQVLLLSLAASISSPLLAMYLVTFADNKVQGFAIAKFAGIAGWTILFGWFVAEPWQWLFGLFPPFLVNKAYWMAYQGSDWWWVVAALGLVLQLAVVFGAAPWVRRSLALTR